MVTAGCCSEGVAQDIVADGAARSLQKVCGLLQMFAEVDAVRGCRRRVLLIFVADDLAFLGCRNILLQMVVQTVAADGYGRLPQ
jgi:hypothetical protein